MHEFIARYRESITGTLSGFDRVVFRGTLRSIAFADGMRSYLQRNDILLKDFGSYVERTSGLLKRSSLTEAQRLGRPSEYLASAHLNKEELARQIAERDGIEQGLICVLRSVEPCQTFEIFRNAGEKKLELVARQRKCLFLYHYGVDPRFGFFNARIQTWFPFTIQICINGREWLGRQMQQAGIRYLKVDNCFPWVEDWKAAQSLLDEQLKTDWPQVLGRIAQQLNPAHDQIFHRYPVQYYWSTYQTEWAIDICFREATQLESLYPRLVHHGMTHLASADVMRYLGRRVRLDGRVPANFVGQVVSTLKHRHEGVRIKHAVNGNSVKLYDKAFTPAGSVLRAETTIQNGDDLRVYRPAEGDPKDHKKWRRLRRGVADVYRRAEISRKAAERYLDSFSTVDDDVTVEQLISRICTRTTWHNRPIRALHPFDQDRQLLSAVIRGEYTLTGFRNRDLQAAFFPAPADSVNEHRRRSAWVSRQLRLLRAHGLITKIPGTHRYRLTPAGTTLITAVLAALSATTRKLTAMAA